MRIFNENKTEVIPYYDIEKGTIVPDVIINESGNSEKIFRFVPYTDVEIDEKRKNSLRENRRVLLEAFDKWEKAVLRGREKDDTSIMNWYRDLLNLVESAFLDENVPERVRYYLGR